MIRAVLATAQCSPLIGIEARACAAIPSARPSQGACQRAFVPAVSHPCGRAQFATRGIEKDGDFGARDPYAGEVATDFGNKTTFSDTLHVIKPPRGMAEVIGLKAKKCVPCEGGTLQPLQPNEVEGMRQQVGWRVVTNVKGQQAIQHDYKVRNFKAAIELLGRIADIAEAEGHHPDLHIVGYNNVQVELTTHAVGALTENDFIIASKINDLNMSDLMPKRKVKYWA